MKRPDIAIRAHDHSGRTVGTAIVIPLRVICRFVDVRQLVVQQCFNGVHRIIRPDYTRLFPRIVTVFGLCERCVGIIFLLFTQIVVRIQQRTFRSFAPEFPVFGDNRKVHSLRRSVRRRIDILLSNLFCDYVCQPYIFLRRYIPKEKNNDTHPKRARL